jgi:hypothetical protein
VTPTAGRVRVRLAVDAEDLAAARGLEHDVFAAEGFIARSDRRCVEEYEELDPQSRWYLAERDGRAVGVLRVLASEPLVVPAVRHFELTADATAELARQRYSEVGTLAVVEADRGTDTGIHLYRAAFRDAVSAGGTAWVSVLEWWLLEHLDASGFRFEPMGTARYYMGGECLPALMLFGDALSVLHRRNPEMHAWIADGLDTGGLAVSTTAAESTATSAGRR